MAVRRYAILHHKLPGGEHWDLLLEQDDTLASWQLSAEPHGPDALPLAAVRIFDHRKRYLDYEGPISGERGSVTQFDGGELRLLETGGQRWLFELAGRVFRGRFCLTRAPDTGADLWTFAVA
ncbi:MAG TPA: DNA polymerase ligase N-terminal domain-containing protein [Phycisphaerae bacterium]|nr:DNA polymerase ligase N-terminal domain-containing protein [Phycisphaerae bacterium]